MKTSVAAISKTVRTFLFSFLCIAGAGTLLQSQSLTVSVTNPSVHTRQSEIITLYLPGLYQSNPEFQGKDISVLEASKILVHQYVDDNVDGIPDILIFQSSFKPHEKKSFTLRPISKTGKEFTSVVDGRFILPRQDFAWENDRIAFRVYGSPLAGDVKNGIDVWTKKVRYPIVKKWYDGEEEVPKRSYHQDHGEGADYFSVGRSLGCGSAGILWKGNLVQSGLFSFYRVIANGPIRISFELYYPALKLDTAEVMEIKRITLDAGSNMNKIEERFISKASIDNLTLAAGLVKRRNTVAVQDAKQGWSAMWGPTTADSAAGFLGTAVVLNGEHPTVATEDSLHFLLSSSSDIKTAFTYYSGAGWTLSGDFGSEIEWKSYVQRYAELLKKPLIITLSKKN